MNYLDHYDRLIERARGRVLAGYKERHHVRPRCMGGGNESDNLVNLTAEEHYIAHQLLVKIYPDNGGLALAVVRMAKQCSGNKAFGWLRRRMADKKRGLQIRLGAVLSAETKAKISAAKFGKGIGRKMPPFSHEHRARISAAKRGQRLSQEHRARIGASNKGKIRSSETREKMSAWQRRENQGFKFGNKHNLGKKASLETRTRMSVSQRLRFSTAMRTG